MNRRDFIKNTSILLGCTCLAGSGKLFYDYHNDNTLPDGTKLKKEYLSERYKNKSELPKKIRIDACTLCQLRCPCCVREFAKAFFLPTFGLGYLSFENFKKFVDNNNFEEIELSNKGEIFLNPELEDIIKYAHSKNIRLRAQAGTNMNYLTDSMAETLVKYKFDYITVSIDGASPETYKIYRVGGDFNTVINNINKINFYKKKYNSPYPYLEYKFILFGHNEHEIDKAKELAIKLNMNMRFDNNLAPSYSPLKNPKLLEKKTGLALVKTRNENDVDHYKNDTSQWIICQQLWDNPQINWDGRVIGCCCSYHGDFGKNAFKDGLLNALNGVEIVYAKNMLTNGAKAIKGIPCTDCDLYNLLLSRGVKLSSKRESNLT